MTSMPFKPFLLALACVATMAPPVQAQTVLIKGYAVQGNQLLDEAHIQRILAPYQGEQNFDGLKQAVSALQQAYTLAGWGAVWVRLPEQDLADGVVRLEVTEGRLGQVHVAGNSQFSADNIRRSLPGLQSNRTPNLLELDAQALVANASPAKNLRLTFQPGLNPAEVDVVATVTEQPVQQTRVQIDNSGVPDTGYWRLGASYTHANIADRDHVLNLALESTAERPDHNPVLSASYRIPFYAQGGALEWHFTDSRSRSASVGTPAGDVHFSGRGRATGVRYQWFLPQAGKAKQQLGAGLDWRQYRNHCAVDGLGSEACGPANNRMEVRPVVVSYQLHEKGHYSAALALSANLLAGGSDGSAARFEQIRPGAKRRYSVLRGQWQSFHELGSSGQQWLGLSLTGQFSPDALVPAEQFGIGGSNTVRGYLYREAAGDQGLVANVEWQRRLSTTLAPGQQLLGKLFFDIGHVRNHQSLPCLPDQTACTLASAGLGLHWLQANQWELRADLARTLRAASHSDKGRWRLHLAASYQF